jgi:hypothetical protein
MDCIDSDVSVDHMLFSLPLGQYQNKFPIISLIQDLYEWTLEGIYKRLRGFLNSHMISCFKICPLHKAVMDCIDSDVSVDHMLFSLPFFFFTFYFAQSPQTCN